MPHEPATDSGGAFLNLMEGDTPWSRFFILHRGQVSPEKKQAPIHLRAPEPAYSHYGVSGVILLCRLRRLHHRHHRRHREGGGGVACGGAGA